MDEYTITKEWSESGESFYVYVDLARHKKVYLNSTFAPEREAERFCENVDEGKVNVIIGAGNGTLIKALLKRKFIHCLIIEPYEDVILNEENKKIVNETNNVTFLYLKDISPLKISEYLSRYIGIQLNILLHPKYDKTNANIIDKVLRIIREGANILQLNKNTEQFFKKEWFIEPLLNLQYTMDLPSINNLKDYFQGETAILVASGPSMREQIPFIKKMNQYAYIFAAGSAVNGLLSYGIIPDFVPVVDAGIKNYTTHFQHSQYNGPLIVGGIVNSNILEKYKESSILANINLDSITTRFRPEVQKFPTVPSVAVFTLALLYYLGFSTVYLVGQDLALINGEYYAEGVKRHQDNNHFKPDMYVESNDGTKVGTTHALYSFLQSFNELVGLFDQDKIKIYNLSKYGAKIESVEYRSSDVIDIPTRKRKPFPKIKMAECFNSGTIILQKFIGEIKAAQSVCREIKNKISKMNVEAVNVKDLKKILKWFIKFRSQKVIEEVFIKQLSYKVQKISNKFEYNFDKDIISYNDRVEMVLDIKELIEEVYSYIEEVLNDERVLKLTESIAIK